MMVPQIDLNNNFCMVTCTESELPNLKRPIGNIAYSTVTENMYVYCDNGWSLISNKYEEPEKIKRLKYKNCPCCGAPTSNHKDSCAYCGVPYEYIIN